MTMKSTSSVALLVPLLVILTIASITSVQAVATPSRSGGTASMPPPAMVLQQMHMVNQMEIKAAKLAKQKATKTPVKRYAERLWRDHHLADHKVQGLAKHLGFKLRSPAQMKQMMRQAKMASSMPTGKQQLMQKMRKKMQMVHKMMSKLQSASRPQFDQAYIMAMIKSHQHAVKMLQKVQARKLNQLQVMGLVDTLLPILKQHLELAEHLQNRAAA